MILSYFETPCLVHAFSHVTWLPSLHIQLFCVSRLIGSSEWFLFHSLKTKKDSLLEWFTADQILFDRMPWRFDEIQSRWEPSRKRLYLRWSMQRPCHCRLANPAPSTDDASWILNYPGYMKNLQSYATLKVLRSKAATARVSLARTIVFAVSFESLSSCFWRQSRGAKKSLEEIVSCCAAFLLIVEILTE